MLQQKYIYYLSQLPFTSILWIFWSISNAGEAFISFNWFAIMPTIKKFQTLTGAKIQRLLWKKVFTLFNSIDNGTINIIQKTVDIVFLYSIFWF